jgi:DNA-binding GntR family transcriptional regulator
MTEDAIAAIAFRRTQSLTAIVQKELERMILSGELKAGERLNEQALAGRLGVSRGPVREATRGLERAGLLSAVVNQGVFVREIAPEEASEIYDLRGALFGFVCHRLAQYLTEEQKSVLLDYVSRMNAMIESGDHAGYYQLNLQFHDTIMEFAGHRRAKLTYESLIKETHLLRQSALANPAHMRESNAEHAAIIAALAAGDAERARQLGEDHARSGKRRWLHTSNLEISPEPAPRA